MKGTPTKSYFRETISSAKKSSKTVTFSGATPPSTTSTARKKPFFSFTKSSNETVNERESSQSPSNLKGFFRKKGQTTQLPVVTKKPVATKEKQICRITLSPKQGSSSASSGVNSKPSFEQSKLIRNANGGTSGNELSESSNQVPTTESQTMGNAHSSRANVNEVTKKITSIVKFNSANFVKDKENRVGDINENIKSHHHHHRSLITSQSTESRVLNSKDESKKQTDSAGVLRNLNSIKEENRLLRLKFFSEDASQSPSPLSPVSSVTEVIEKSNMNRQNFIGNKTAIPQPKSAGVKTTNNSTGIPKLYSVPIADKQDSSKKTSGPTSTSLNSKLKFGSKVDISQQQPTNLNNGKWVPATEFFEPPTETVRPQTSPAVTRNSRRLSEPPRWPPGTVGNKLGKRQDPLPNDHTVERRGTIAFQPRRVPVGQTGGIPKFAKPVAPPSERGATGFKGATSTSSKIGIRKPEETKPFYTIGLYQNQRKPQQTQAARSFGVLQSGFHGVSTGIVRQRTEQFQSKVSETSKSSHNTSQETQEANKTEKGNKSSRHGSPSPGKPGVIRSATYTIRKHPTVEQVSTSVEKESSGSSLVVDSKSDVDPRYLTWTVKKSSGTGANLKRSLISTTSEQLEDSISSESSMISSIQSRFTDSVGYPLQHNASGTSTSSMGTNEDGVGDHVMISDSEYLIDDEISDQPELTLTFKDSSLILSPSSSGESLLSCDIMLDHLDHKQERILGELTSDSAISDISSHKPTSQCSSDQISKLSDIKQPIIDEHTKVMGLRSSPSDTGSPSSVRTVRHPKSPRRCVKTTPGYNSSRTARQTSGDATSIPRLTSSDFKSPVSNPVKSHTTPEKRLPSAKPNHVRTILTGSASLSPINPNRSAKKDNSVAGLTIENVNKLHKQFEFVDSEYNAVDHDQNRLPVPLVDEILSEFQGLKDKLGELQIQLDTQERREREKDELIQRLTVEVKRLKSLVGEEPVTKPHHRNGSVIPILSENSNDISSPKECYINSLNYENAAVQTENNNIFNRAVTYPDEDDKYGELVSFRIGRSSSVKKKL
ncbi:unnamed protein product [Orchesella dallaii]|uniref:Uncharacterized protein n=1 Tax=Orchesella dallaii TaxID=48710 RepID=A0ABP1RFR5_9HEXA